jgi:hypothetical protein
MKNIYDLLERMKQYPVMYLGKNEISLLKIYFDGYYQAKDAFGIKNFEMPPFPLFHLWTSHKLWGRNSSADWNTIILEENGGNETKALEQFFVLLDEFKQLRPLKMLKVSINEANKDFYQIVKEKNREYNPINFNEVEEELPYAFYIVEFEGNIICQNYKIKAGQSLEVDWWHDNKKEAIESIEYWYGPGLTTTEIAQSEVVPMLEKLTSLGSVL